MAPASGKRKRPDRQHSQEDGYGRPSPHRPESLNLAQQNQQQNTRGSNGRGGGGRRSSRQISNAPSSPAASARVATPTPAHNTENPEQMQNVQRTTTTTATAGVVTSTAPAPRTATPLPPSQNETRSEPAWPFAYEHLTDEIVDTWKDSGKQSIFDTAKSEDVSTASALIQELLRSSLDGRLNPAEAGAVVKEMISQHQDAGAVDIQSLFMDTISLLEGAESQSRSLHALVVATGIDPAIIRRELDVPLLQSLQLVRNTFTQMRTRKTTNILYRQANFNLLREESEGYAKLITDYYNAAQDANSDGSDPEMAKDAFHRIMALVGAFDLDVGRVLDITLDISANSLVKSYRFFVKFYRASSWWPDNAVLDNIRWTQDGPGSLPGWALPGSKKWQYDEEDKERLAMSRYERDSRFWQRLREVGTDAFFELGSRRIVDFDAALPLLEQEAQPEFDAKGREINAHQRTRINESRKYMRETRTLPPLGNSDAAQLLGFKLRFYASAARDTQDSLPENLVYLAALLIKTGFVSLRDIYPHLYPPDAGMNAERERLEKEKADKERKERPGGGMNALAMAGALADDTVPAVRNLRAETARSGGNSPKPDKKDEDSKDGLPPPTNQKILLLKGLLAIGALPEALFILGRFPWLAEVDTSLTPYLHRIANHMLSALCEKVRPLAGREDVQDTKQQLAETTIKPDGSLFLLPRPKTKIRKWLGLDGPDNGDGFVERHYYTDWDDNIPVCQNVEDFVLLCNTFFNYLGVKIGQDPLLMTTFVRLARHDLNQNNSDSNRSRWLDLMKRLIVPALSLTKHNAAITQEVYNLLQLFPTTTRYDIYEEWYTGRTSRLPDIKVAFEKNRAEVKDVLRRITNESGKKQARALAKVTFASPGIVMMTFINQLESYSNMIPGLVDSVRYFSPLAFDVLTWVLIRSLNGQGRDRMQADGMLTSAWLQALSQFVASLFTRYVVVNPSPVLQYVASELRLGDSTDLELVDQVLAEMAGIRSDMNFNDAQVLAMTGGDALQSQIVQQLADVRHQRKSSAKRLMKALSEPGIVGQILIAIAQERQMYSHRESAKYMPLKVLGNNMDKIQQVFSQYLDVLKTNLTPTEFEENVPDIISLVGDFGIEPGAAFTICRTAIAHHMAEIDAAKKQQQEEEKQKRLQNQATAKENTDTDMQDAEAKPTLNGHSVDSSETKDDVAKDQSNGEAIVQDVQAERKVNGDAKAEPVVNPPLVTTLSGDGEKAPWHPVLENLMDRLPDVTGDLTDRVSISFFVTFWTLCQHDVHVPTDSYQNEIQRLEQQIKEISKDRSDLSAIATKEREKKRRALQDLISQLTREVSSRVGAFTNMKIWINSQKRHWFPRTNDSATKDARHLGLLQECFLPRALMSSLDAHYCFMILKIMHNNGTPGFSMMHLLHQLMRKRLLSAIIFQCTAREAENFGRLLCEILKQLAHWHSSKTIYEKEALGSQRQLPGFALKVDEKGTPTVMLEYEPFRRLLLNWHTYLKDAFKTCFESGEYMQIRNGIIVLKSIYTVFPALKHQGKEMQERVKAISTDDTRGDLKLAALSLQGPLKSRESKWVMPQDFRLNDPSKESRDPAKTDTQPDNAASADMQSVDNAPMLSATAPDFKPGGVSLTNGEARKASIAGAEDGEIEDEKQASTKDEDVVLKDAPNVDEANADAPANDSSSSSDVPNAPSQKPLPTKVEPKTTPNVPEKPLPALNGAVRSENDRQLPAHNPHQRRDPNLPSRPEAAASSKAPPGPPNARYSSRSDDRYGRLDRPSDVRIPASRERSPGPRSRARTPERGTPSQSRSFRDERPALRTQLPDGRYQREEPRGGPRREVSAPIAPTVSSIRQGADTRDRNNELASHAPHPERASQLNRTDITLPSQAADARLPPSGTPQQSTTAVSQPVINPQRAALINEEPAARGRNWEEKDRRREFQNNRPEPRQDERPNGRNVEPSRDTQPRPERAADHAPTAPRATRGGPPSGRDLFDQTSQRGPPAEPSRRPGRDNMPPPGQSESSYGRLNGDAESLPTSRAPNGPSGGRGSRNFTAPHPPLSSRVGDSTIQTSAARPPASPAATRNHQRLASTDRPSSSHTERAPAANSVQSTPSEAGPDVHPSRRQMLGGPTAPPPLETNVTPSSNSRNVGSPATAPPSGPRSHNRPPPGTPTGPSPTNGLPMAAGFGVDRQRRSDRQRASINATLQQVTPIAPPPPPPASQGVQFRGAARQGGAGAGPDQPQAIASSMDTPPRREQPSAQPSTVPPSRAEARPDLFQRDDRRESGNRRYEEERNDYRQRGSRNPSRERRPDDEQTRRPAPATLDDSRGPRGPPRNEERRIPEERGSRDGPPRERRNGRDEDVPPRRPAADAPGQFPGPPPDWENRGPRRDGTDDRARGPRGIGRGQQEEFRGPRRVEDERRDMGRGGNRGDLGPPPPGPDGRKRRHDDGPPPFDITKRRRSGR